MIRLIRNVLFAAAGFLAARRVVRRRSERSEHALPPPEESARRGRPGLKTFLKRLALLVPVLAVLGFLVAASGIIPLKASSGHWAITRWLLNFSMERSVATHSLGIKSPPLDDPLLILKGAGHYDFGCRPCHGGPQRDHPRIPLQMTPHPPHLPTTVPRFKPRELFYVVKHGEKFTGMPAWPAQTRDDEVWAVVAFLMQMPGMDVDEYTALVEGPTAPATPRDETRVLPDTSLGIHSADTTAAPDTLESRVVMSTGEADMITSPEDDTLGRSEAELTEGDIVKEAASAPIEGMILPQGVAAGAEVPVAVNDRCGRCHGLDGGGRGVGAFPRLAGQRPNYIYATLVAYAEGERHSGIMQPIAAALTEEEMREIALYYAALDARAVVPDEEAGEAAERGRRIAHEGIPGKRVPSCVDCHGPGSGLRNPFYPNLAGQYAEYIELQLELFKDEKRGGSAYARLMHPTADDLSKQEMHDVARYYETLRDMSDAGAASAVEDGAPNPTSE